MIEGVIITPLKQIVDDRGKVMHMLRSDNKVFEKFGEIYFSHTNPKAIKAWHKHKEMTLNYACIEGEVKFVLFDDRETSVTKGKIQELILSPKNYFLVTVPPLIWNGFKGNGTKYSIVANCSTIPHRDDDIIRKPVNDSSIPYFWES
tara:strand:+ start:299 stop:739 length:441 start_codon:yes stop_codon:yes gene_type:complete